METEQTKSLWTVADLTPYKTALLASLVAILCYAGAVLGGTLEILPEANWPFWPANALIVSVLVLVPRRIWPIILAAALFSFVSFNLRSGLTLEPIFWLSLSDIIEVVTAALGLRYCFENIPHLNSLKALGKYAFFVGFLAPFAGAFFGAMGAKGQYWTSWRISFLAEAIAYFTILPAILGWVARARTESPREWRAPYLEATVLLAAIVSVSVFAFVSRWSSSLSELPFLLVPFLLWSALRFGTAGAGSAASIVAFVSVWGAAHGRGPFTEAAHMNDVLSLQLFLLSAAVPFMALAALVEGHSLDEKVLRESEKRFRLVADTAPVLIWMSGTDKLCTFFNKGWLDFTGRSMEQELGNGWVSDVHPEDVQRCIQIYKSSFDTRREFEMEYRLLRFDGVYRWIVDYGVPRFESDGTFCGYIGSCVDITERKSSEESLQALTGRLINAQEAERTRIARELHDDFSQRLAVLAVGLEQLWKVLPGSRGGERERVQEMLKGTKELSSDLHTLSHQLHSSRLEHVGLVSALRGLCKEISQNYKIEVQFAGCELTHKPSEDVALCLFRVTQEALGNVVKHSRATAAQVKLDANAEGLRLRIGDNGQGFDTSRAIPSSGMGLMGMQERIRLVGGRFLVTSELAHGSEILAEVPLKSGTDETKTNIQAAGR